MLSAEGWIVSRRYRAMVASETLTGAEKPDAGLISTLPSILGYRSMCALVFFILPSSRQDNIRPSCDARTRVAEMPGYPTKKLLFGGPHIRTAAGTCLSACAMVGVVVAGESDYSASAAIEPERASFVVPLAIVVVRGGRANVPRASRGR
jgi:hypothetical protein